MGTFRDRMDRDLQIRGYSLNTRKSYLGYVKDFVRYFMLPPDQLTIEHIHRYQLHLTYFKRSIFYPRHFHCGRMRRNAVCSHQEVCEDG